MHQNSSQTQPQENALPLSLEEIRVHTSCTIGALCYETNTYRVHNKDHLRVLKATLLRAKDIWFFNNRQDYVGPCIGGFFQVSLGESCLSWEMSLKLFHLCEGTWYMPPPCLGPSSSGTAIYSLYSAGEFSEHCLETNFVFFFFLKL